MRWLLSWLFPLWTMLPRARVIGAVSFQTVEGVGWMCTIRPPYSQQWKRGAINSWSGSGKTLGQALRSVLAETEDKPSEAFDGSRFEPKLGGDEFDPEP